jgi:hypothetical protein
MESPTTKTAHETACTERTACGGTGYRILRAGAERARVDDQTGLGWMREPERHDPGLDHPGDSIQD